MLFFLSLAGAGWVLYCWPILPGWLGRLVDEQCSASFLLNEAESGEQ